MSASIKREILNKLEELVKDRVAPGFQLVLGHKKETLGCFVVGLRDAMNNKPVTPSTWFDLASLTKIISTVDLLMLARQEGRIESLDVPLSRWF